MPPQDTVDETNAASAAASAETAAQAALVTAGAQASAASAAQAAAQEIHNTEVRVDEAIEEQEEELAWLRQELLTLTENQTATRTELEQIRAVITTLPEMVRTEFQAALDRLTQQQRQQAQEHPPEAIPEAVAQEGADGQPEVRTNKPPAKRHHWI